MTHQAENSWMVVDRKTGLAVFEHYGTMPQLKKPDQYVLMRPSEYLLTLNKQVS